MDRIQGGPMECTERIEVECRGVATGDRFAELGECAIEQTCDLKEAPRPRAPALEHGEERLTGGTVEPQGTHRQLAEPVDELLARSVLLVEHERCLHADVDRFADRWDRHQVDDTDATAALAQREPASLWSRRLRSGGGHRALSHAFETCPQHGGRRERGEKDDQQDRGVVALADDRL